MKYIDLTHTLTTSMPVYPGDPVPELVQIADVQKGGYTDHHIKTGMHVGTHIDGPLHMLKGGKKLSEIEVGKFFGRGVLVDARGKAVIDEEILSRASITRGDIVLILTGFSEKYGKPEYYETYPELSEGFGQKIIGSGVKMLGLDSPSPDRSPWKIHKILLKEEILIIENLTNAEQLIGVPSFEVFALPVKFDADAAPARVVVGWV